MGNHFLPFFSDNRSDEFSKVGLGFSIGAHLVLLGGMILNFGSGWGEFEEPIVYSVTIEGGKKLGGMMQVPDKDAKSQVAPPKNVSASQKKIEEQKIEPVKPEEKAVEEKKIEPVKKEEPKIEEKGPVAPIETPKVEPKKVEPKKEEVKKEEPKKEIPKEKPQESKKTDAPKKEEIQKEEKKKDTSGDLNKKYEEAMQRYLGESSNAGGSGFGAAAVGGSGMGGGVVRPPEFFIYLKKLEEYVKSGWVWSDTGGSPKAQIVFSMSPDGRLSDIRITRGSGVREFDDSVFRAVSKASPVPPPPPSVYEFFRSIRMTFDPHE